MDLRKALETWADERMQPVPETLNACIELLGGTAAVAHEVGVTVRTVERWAKAERGEPGQIRHPSPASQERLDALYERAPAMDLTSRIESGLNVAELAGAFKVSNDKRARSVKDVEIEPDALYQFARAMAGGDYEYAAELFIAEWADAYGMSRPDLLEIGELATFEMEAIADL